MELPSIGPTSKVAVSTSTSPTPNLLGGDEPLLTASTTGTVVKGRVGFSSGSAHQESNGNKLEISTAAGTRPIRASSARVRRQEVDEQPARPKSSADSRRPISRPSTASRVQVQPSQVSYIAPEQDESGEDGRVVSSFFGNFSGRKFISGARPHSASFDSSQHTTNPTSSHFQLAEDVFGNLPMDRKSRKAVLGHLQQQQEGRKEVAASGGLMAAFKPRIRPQSALMFRDLAKTEQKKVHDTSIKPSASIDEFMELPTLFENDVRPVELLFQMLPHRTIDPEDALMQLKSDPQTLFVDKTFPAGPDSLSWNRARASSAAFDVVKWAYPQQLSASPVLFGAGGPAETDVIQGSLGDCWFLGALSLIACHGSLVHNLFSHFSRLDASIDYDFLMQKGMMTVQFYKDCDWHDVTIDTMLPVAEDGHLAFGKCANMNEFWVPLIEKAFAKLHGSYEALHGGSVADALVDLTGGVCERINLWSDKSQSDIQSGKTWNSLLRHRRLGHMLGITITDREAELQGITETTSGILYNHTYTIVDIRQVQGFHLVRLRNPWGTGEWVGDWSDCSDMWLQNVSVANALDFRAQADGTFWMSFDDLIRSFNKLYVCRVIPSHWHSAALRGEWTQTTSGGPPGGHMFFTNPQFRVWSMEPGGGKVGEMTLGLSQRDARREGGCTVAMIGVAIYKYRRSQLLPRVWQASDATLVVNIEPSEVREVSCSFKIEPGCLYYIVPYTLFPGHVAPFAIRMYSSVAFDVQRVPLLLSDHRQDIWRGAKAGGRRIHPTFVNNPQWLLSTAVTSPCCAVLRRTSEQRDESTSSSSTTGSSIGMCIVNVKDQDKGGPNRVVSAGDGALLYETDFSLRDIAVLHFRLPGGKPYAIIPSCYDPGVQGNFTLSIYSDAAVAVEKIADLRFVSCSGQWARGMAGGSHVHDTWKTNPQFIVRIPAPVMVKPKLKFRLVREESEWKRQVLRDPIGSMLGLYVFKSNQRVYDRSAAPLMLETTFLPGNFSEGTLDTLRASETSLVVVCSTFNPNKIGSFSLEVSCNVDIWVEPLKASHGGPATQNSQMEESVIEPQEEADVSKPKAKPFLRRSRPTSGSPSSSKSPPHK